MYVLSSGNVTKYECLTSKDVLPEKDLLQKAAAIKRIEYPPLGEELKAQASFAERQYEKLEKFLMLIKGRKIKRSHAKSNLVYSNEFAFYKYHSAKQLSKRSFYSKWNDLIEFKDILELFYGDTQETKPNNEDQRKA